MCSGRVDLEFILRAFLNGQDGVLIGGCKLDECNYITHGNFHALNMVQLCKKIMEYIGLDPERLRIQFMSGADGGLLAEVTNEFTKQIKDIGPLGKSEGLDEDVLKSRIKDVMKLIPYIKIVKREKLDLHFDTLEEYDELYTRDEVDQLFGEVVSYYIDPEKCQACMTCSRKCPVEAIIGRKKQIHVIDQEKCIKCGTCLEACPPRFGAVTKLCGEPVPPPVPEDQRAIVKKSKVKS